MPTLKRILAEGLDQCLLTLPAPAPETPLRFARPVEELAAAIFETGPEGGERWN